MEKTIVTILGVVFVAIGILGFVNDPLLGIFEVSPVHNIIHILSGILALAAVSMGMGATKTFAKVFGIVYGLVAVLGFVLPSVLDALLVETNLADHVLHVVLAVVFLWIGFGSADEPMASGAPSAPAAGM